jgi:hypothetical protein
MRKLERSDLSAAGLKKQLALVDAGVENGKYGKRQGAVLKKGLRVMRRMVQLEDQYARLRDKPS